MTKYRIGYDAERRARMLLEEQGYFVIRAAGSKGLFDLVGFSPKDIRLISVKVVASKTFQVFKTHQLELRRLPVPPFVVKELWIWEKKKAWHYYPC